MMSQQLCAWLHVCPPLEKGEARTQVPNLTPQQTTCVLSKTKGATVSGCYTYCTKIRQHMIVFYFLPT